MTVTELKAKVPASEFMGWIRYWNWQASQSEDKPTNLLDLDGDDFARALGG